LNAGLNPRRDEGVGYLSEDLLSALYDLRSIENTINSITAQSGCQGAIRNELERKWQTFWGQRTVPSAWGDGGIYDEPGRFGDTVAFDYDWMDFANFREVLGVDVGCATVAEAFNDMLGRQGCCLMFNCRANGADSFMMYAGVTIDVMLW